MPPIRWGRAWPARAPEVPFIVHTGHHLELVAGFGPSVPAEASIALGGRALRLGRAPDNDLVLPDDTVSWHHATIGLERGVVRVQDLGSTNGTWIDDRRVDGAEVLHPGAHLRLGRNTVLRLGSTVTRIATVAQYWRLEVVETGASLAIPDEGLRVGPGLEADLSLQLDDEASFVASPTGTGAVIQVLGERPWMVGPGVSFTVGGRAFRVLPTHSPPVRTAGAQSPSDRYRLRVALDGPGGPEAVLLDPERGLRHEVGADNRAVLLYLLAVRLITDRADGVPITRRGWCSDEELAIGIWGREAARMEINNLHVLLHRLRRELVDAGFDSGFLEKKSRALRARLVHVVRE
jgi:hypothetical protein